MWACCGEVLVVESVVEATSWWSRAGRDFSCFVEASFFQQKSWWEGCFGHCHACRGSRSGGSVGVFRVSGEKKINHSTIEQAPLGIEPNIRISTL